MGAQNVGTGSNGSLTDEQKRLVIGERNLALTRELLKTRRYANDVERQGLRGDRNSQETELKQLRSQVSVSETQFKLSKDLASIRGSTAGHASKEYAATQATLQALEAERKAVEGINLSRTRTVEIAQAEAQAAAQAMREALLANKTPGAVNEMMFEERKRRTQIQHFRDKDDRTDGLLSVHKDMAGNILDGIDPLTGERRAPAAGKGRAEQGLHGGVNSANGKGGLFTSGLDDGPGTGSIVPPMFTKTSAQDALDKAPSAADRLFRMTGDPAHDPAARLANATIFPDLHHRATVKRLAAVRKEGSGLHTGGLVTGNLSGGAVALSQASKPTPPHPQSNRNHQSLIQVIGELNEKLGGILNEAMKVSSGWEQ